MKVTAIERTGGAWLGGAQDRATANAPRHAHLASPTTSADAPALEASARSLPVLGVGNETTVHAQPDLAVVPAAAPAAARAQDKVQAAAQPPQEPLSKQLMELVSHLWAASRAAVDAVQPPVSYPVSAPAPAPGTPAVERRGAQRVPSDAAPASPPSVLAQTYNTRAHRNSVERKA